MSDEELIQRFDGLREIHEEKFKEANLVSLDVGQKADRKDKTDRHLGGLGRFFWGNTVGSVKRGVNIIKFQLGALKTEVTGTPRQTTDRVKSDERLKLDEHYSRKAQKEGDEIENEAPQEEQETLREILDGIKFGRKIY
ncbi:hypothetical protein [Rhizobium sp. FKL33]|uniref:hypothetical protein n=1 Tax=Rhizobium sp. FKL33 TaxID=2562307 RepID=UPI0010C1063A|nr:hypothetical protein [Rhizobium sp. FKL33]